MDEEDAPWQDEPEGEPEETAQPYEVEEAPLTLPFAFKRAKTLKDEPMRRQQPQVAAKRSSNKVIPHLLKTSRSEKFDKMLTRVRKAEEAAKNK